jgi:dihydrofolate synthase/folylpolyglutamate synthase
VNSFKEVLEYLDSLINYEVEFPLGGSRDRPKLESVYQAARELKLPLELSKCIHIAGTVGKGSVAAMSQALLSIHHRVLTFTSPHLVTPKERVQLDGKNLSDEIWIEGMSYLREKLGDLNLKLTYFETVFVFFLWCSQKLGTTAHVVETGLGGSFDATNVLTHTTAVLCRIDFDHTHILGKTLAEIAGDKSGIIKNSANCFTVTQSVEALHELEIACLRNSGTLYVEGRDFETNRTFTIPLKGEYQRSNLSVSLAAVKSLDPELTNDDIQSALNGLSLAARQQSLSNHPNLLLDVCHNPISFAELAAYLRSNAHFEKRVALVAMMKDKDARESLRYFVRVVDEVWLTEAPTPRTYSAAVLKQIADELGLNTRVVDRENAYKEMLALPGTTQGIVCGSFYLVGDFMKSFPDA